MWEAVLGHMERFRCRRGEFYVALGYGMSLAHLVWGGGELLKWVLSVVDVANAAPVSRFSG